MKKAISVLVSAAMAVSMLAGTAATVSADEAAGKVYYLNFKPEADEAWQKLAAAYTEETGVPVSVVTAASGEYETTLMSEMGKSDAPTLFVAYVIESYGIIVNKALLEKAGYKLEDITGFDALKSIADDIQARKDELGVEGAFSCAGMDASSDWRFKTHLANLPIYYEYKADGIDNTDAIKGDFLDNYKAVFDLYITDSTCEGAELSAKTADDSRAEFADSKAVFYQNGSWEYSSLSETFSDDDLAMIPIYFGVDDENQGLCTGTENYWCVNNGASEEDIQATLDFINWCVTSETGTTAMANDMGFVIPFTTAQESPNLFVKQDAEYTAAGKTPVSWNFTTMPSEEWKNGVGSALTAYAAGTGEWDAVVSAFVDGWASEAALAG